MARYTKGGDVVRVPQINAELEKIEQAFENTLSRDGDAPNQMNAPIDMNGYKIVNVQTDITDPNSLVQRSDLYVKSEVDAKDAQAVLDANAFAVNQDNAVLAAAQAYAEELAGEPVNTVRYVQEELPVGPIISGARWYKPSEGVTYVYYVDGDSSQWVQETVNSFEGTLRGELADANSDVLVGGVEAKSTQKSFSTLSDLKLYSGSIGQYVSTRGYATEGDGGGADYVIVAGGTGTPDDGAFISLTNGLQAQLLCATILYPKQWGVLNLPTDSSRIQAMLDFAPNNTVIDASGCEIQMDSIVTLSSKDHIKVKGGRWYWNHQGSNMIQLTGTLVSPQFEDMEVFGNNDAFLSQGAIGCPSGTITTNWSVTDCAFKEIPFGVYINADNSGQHVSPIVEGCSFTDMPRFTNDSSSGAGLGVVFASGGGVIKGGLSKNNVFIRCGRHSLYVSNGGNVTSLCDTFIEHRNDGGATPIELAAMQITREANNVNILFPKFIESRDLALAVQAVQTSGSPTFGSGVTIKSPEFINNFDVDIKLGNDSPAANGIVNSIFISDVYIKQSGTNNANRIQVFSGKRIRIRGVVVEADLTAGVTSLVDVLRVFDTATPSFLDDVIISDVAGDIAGSTSRGVNVGDGVLTGTHSLRLEDVKVGSTEIFQGVSVTPSNPNYLKLKDNKPVVFSAFTAAFTNAASEVNTVDKYAGKKIFSLSGGVVKPLYATGSAATDTWVDGAGTVVHTPV